MKSEISRDRVKNSFAPFVPFIEEAVVEARDESDLAVIAEVHPRVKRLAHRRRVSGSLRWMVLADGLVARAPRFPSGFGLESTEVDHNAGKYAFRVPLGVCTIKGEPHEEDKGKYLQECLFEQLQLADDVDAFVGIKAYISVPPEGPVRLIVTHPTLSEPMVVMLDEIDLGEGPGSVAAIRPTAPLTGPTVTSTLDEDETGVDGKSR